MSVAKIRRGMDSSRSLDAADPPPRREEPRFAGDYKAFRAAFQAWDCRERRRRKKVQLHDADAADVPAGAEHEMPNTKPAKRKYRSMLPRPRHLDVKPSTRRRTSRTRWPSVAQLAT